MLNSMVKSVAIPILYEIGTPIESKTTNERTKTNISKTSIY
jgi:hypothetical protein